MNSKHACVLKTIFSNPVASNIEWRAIEKLLLAIGCQRLEGNGSRVRFICRGVVASFHRPHPAREAKQYQVRDAREFLTKIGVKP